ncbi:MULTISPECIES: hypothetical protein [Hyphobacterium]|uniref:Uncharacterized protein n=1 Tax=Hyphobacterium vulgare TaxID=1736751 RepID=A0ABV6ZUE8_9PROT
MTCFKTRPADSFPDAVTRIMGELTAEGAGEIIGTRGGRVRAASDPDQVNYSPLSIEQALLLDIAFAKATGREGPMLRAFRIQYCAEVGDACEHLPIVTRIGSIARESGEALHAMSAMVHPDSPGGAETTPSEARAAIKELDEMIREAEAAKADLIRKAGLSR